MEILNYTQKKREQYSELIPSFKSYQLLPSVFIILSCFSILKQI